MSVRPELIYFYITGNMLKLIALFESFQFLYAQKM